MKKLLSILLTLCLIISIASVSFANAEQATSRWGGGTVYLGGYINCAVKPISGCKYAFYVYKGGQAIYKGAYSNTPKISYKPTTVGAYKVMAFFKYANGKKATSTSAAYNVITPAELKSSNIVNTNQILLGENFVVTTKAWGGVKPYSYASYVYKDGVCIYKGGYTQYMTYTYKPTSAGTYHVVRFVKDAMGKKILQASPKVGVTKPLYKALLIGQIDYLENTDLHSSLKNINLMAELLTQKGAYGPAEVVKKTNLTATQILESIRTSFVNTNENSISVFYYSGHGAKASGLIADWNGGLGGVDEVTLKPIDLANELNKLNGKVIVILDCCHSGSYINKAGDSFIQAFAKFDKQIKYGEMLTNKFHVITGSKGAETSMSYSDGSGSLLTLGIYNAATKGDTNKDGILSMHEAYTYANGYVYNICTSTTNNLNGYVQKPQCYPLNDNLVLFKVN